MDTRPVVRILAFVLGSLLVTLPAQAEQAAAGARQSVTAQTLAGSDPIPQQTLPMEELRTLLSSRDLPLPQIVSEQFLQLEGFYASRGYAPLWVDATGLGPKGKTLIARLRVAAAAGAPSLTPLLVEAEDRIRSVSGQPLAELELLLSAAFLDAAIHPYDPATTIERPEALVQVAESLNILLAMRDRLPADTAFWRLRAAIQAYRLLEANGGWPAVPAGPKLELGDIDPRVEKLRRRLLATGDLTESDSKPEEYDIALHAAVSRFQARHGLEVDGIVGKSTLAALNVPIEERLATMRLNLRRLQQQHREWGRRYVVVNTAAASYRLVDRGQKVFERVAIVGRRDWPTPQLDSVIDRLEFNPYWVVPPRIARLEVLPRTRRDPNYMRDNDMHWVDGQIRQNPGPRNPLGKVKFLFPNPYSVYLHDTNSPLLFERWDRFLSHGCMRIPNALDMAMYLLKDDPQWPLQRIDQALQSGQMVPVRLAAPIPIHVVYDTAWVDNAGIVQFRQDAYRRDNPAARAIANAASVHPTDCVVQTAVGSR